MTVPNLSVPAAETAYAVGAASIALGALRVLDLGTVVRRVSIGLVVFEHDHVVVADEAGRGAVQEIGAGGADFPVGAGDLGLAFARFAEPFWHRAMRRW